MNVVFEFLDNEPIENIITCMNFKVDKVVFFGYHSAIQSQKDRTEKFLKTYCKVKNVVFWQLSKDDLQSVLRTMRKEIQQEIDHGNDIFFDITGGESLILVAFGMLSKEIETPMHYFDVRKNKLIELEEGARKSISTEVPRQNVKLGLDCFVELHGGVVNQKLHKQSKEKVGPEFDHEVAQLWKVAKKHASCWNNFSDLMRTLKVDSNLRVSASKERLKKSVKGELTNQKRLESIIRDLSEKELIVDAVCNEKELSFRYKNNTVKECIWDGGSVLEFHTSQAERCSSDECRVGVHLDWDGVIHVSNQEDVVNEIDVLSITDGIPTFISCKSGKLDRANSLHAMYELETIAKRFGGKYAKKVLVTMAPLSEACMERAAEMGIELR